MARQGNWNKSFWKRLDNLGEIDQQAITNIINEETGKVEAVLQSRTPVLYGGLKASSYAVVVPTATGVSGRVGYTNTPHIDLDPNDPGFDGFTNVQLAQWLIENGNDITAEKMYDILDAMEAFPENVKNRLKEYFKNGGKQ